MSKKKPAYRALLRAADHPWAITQPMLKQIAQIALRANDVVKQALEADRGAPLENTYEANIREGVAVIPVHGVLSRYASCFQEVSGMTSYDWIAQDFRKAVNNGAVRAILLDIDSPGGEVNGVDELAKQIRAARGKKPIVAYVGGQACSAAYWLASASDRIVCQATSELGSIGIVMMLTDYSKQEEMEGIDRIEFVSSRSPNKRLDPESDEGRAAIIAQCDALYDVFVQTVADNRGVTPKEVQSDYGQGGSFIGQTAIDQGLADQLGDFESLFAELAGRDEPASEPIASPTATTARRKAMAMKTKTAASKKPPVATSKSAKVKAKSKADIDQEVEDEEEIEDEENQLDAEDGDEKDPSAEDDEDKESGADESEDDDERVEDEKGAEDEEDETDEKPAQSKKSRRALGGERGRIAAILQSNAAQGRKELAEHLAFETDLSARDAVNILKTAPRASASIAPDFRKALAGGNPKVGAAGGGKPTGEAAEIAETLALAKKAGLA